MDAHLATKFSARRELLIALRAPDPIAHAATVPARVNKHAVPVEMAHWSNEKSHTNHCFITGTSRRGASHEPASYVRCCVLISVPKGRSVNRAARTPDFVASDRVLPKVSFPLVPSTTYAQPEIDRLPFWFSVN